MSDSRFTVVQGEIGPPPLFTPDDLELLEYLLLRDEGMIYNDLRFKDLSNLRDRLAQWLDQESDRTFWQEVQAHANLSMDRLIDETDLSEG